ncbi:MULTISPECIES: ATP-binding protein [unclassified Tychonema]|uniref:sensor histidine kinase n=1 Tax=unclassified Tychonema TaxID=2642144 RepID=UPI001882208E|nr:MULTISPECIES: ATP-binding protein [unclassified Tychonema]MBE9093428.1 HAMP domain-containing protein [Tychonema sp. LEGE 07203]MBE9122352.1 HAMP domain-containing protein [Tychonema sp. LEGE 07199]MBE9134438.1 HAMP domain-containing protein [Tychonema sp. LEGE 07196]
MVKISEKIDVNLNIIPMHSQNHKQAVVQMPSPIKTSTDFKLGPNWLQQLLRRAPIRLKISLGYALILSIAVLGTTCGQLVGNFYTKKALHKLGLEQEKAQILSEMKIAVMETQSNQKKLIFVTGDPQEFVDEKGEFLTQLKKASQLLYSLKILGDSSFNQADTDIIQLNQFLHKYDSTQIAYTQKIQRTLQQIDPKRLGQKTGIAAQQSLWDFTKSPEAILFNELSEDLTKFVKLAYLGQEQAKFQLESARKIGIQISIASLLLSLIGATIFALSISRMISQPIETLTKVASSATKKSNFSLQAPVTTDDEVGELTIAFNSLIQSVKEHIEALEISKQSLEIRVTERTEELSQKNHELQSAYDQLADALQNLQQTQAQLIQAEKMSSLGQMVAGIAHEINNPVSFIYSNLEHASNYAQDLMRLVQLYQQQYPNHNSVIQAETEAIDLDFMAEDFAKIIHSMKNGADRIRRIVLSLRNFSRLDESQLKLANIHEGIDSTLVILNQRLEGKITVIKDYEYLPRVKCYAALLNQVFMNIIDNAIGAIEERKVNSKASSDATEKPTIWIHTETIDTELVRIEIRDNGTGIMPEFLPKVFDPFFTTKDVGKGTGLGLTISYQLIEKHQGKIEVFSERGAGTKFWITLPVEPS